MAGPSENLRNQQALNEELDKTYSKYREQRSLLEELNASLGKKVNKVRDSRDAMDSLIKITTKLAQQEDQLVRLSDKELDNLSAKAQFQINELQDSAKILAQKKIGYGFDGMINDATVDRLKFLGKINEEEEELLRAAANNFDIQRDTVQFVAEEVEIRKESNRLMGVAGGLISGLNAVAGKFASAFKLDQVQKDMEKLADEIARGEKAGNRLTVLGAGLKSAFSGLTATITDPTVVLGAIFKGFAKVEAQQQEFRRITGQNADAYRGLNGSLTTTSQYLKGMVTLTKELGVNANVAFDSKTVTTVTELVEEMGMAGKEAAKLAQLSKVSGTNLKDNLKGIEGTFKGFVKTNGVALNYGDILNDVGGVSDEIAVSLGNNPQAIASAAMEARKLGLSLQQVDAIAGNLLNFEQSISNELEAELLTGTALNLEKARELALTNDLEGLSKEIGKNSEINAAFSSGNRIQQEAVAKAMGMTRNDMASMILKQKTIGGLSVEQAAAAADISLEEAKRLTTQQQITESLDKMSQALAPILSGVASLLSNSFVLYTTMGALSVLYVSKMIPQVGTLIAKYASLGAIKLVNIIRTWAGVAATTAQTAANTGLATSQTALGTTGAAAGGGMAAAGAGLGAFGAAAAPAIPVILAIGAALLMASPAIYAFSFVIEALGNIIVGVFQSLPPIITAIADGFTKFLGAITFEKAAALPLVGLGLVSLAAGVIAMAVATPFLPLAALGIWALGYAIDPLADSMAKLAPNIESLGSSLSTLSGVAPQLFGVAAGLGAISAGLTSMAITGLLALPIIGALTTLGTVSNTLGSMFGGEGESPKEDKGMEKVNSNLEKLIALVEAGGDVYIDGSKVGKTLQLSSSKMG